MSERNGPKKDARDEGLANRSVNSPRRPAGADETPRPSPVTGSKDPAKFPTSRFRETAKRVDAYASERLSAGTAKNGTTAQTTLKAAKAITGS